MTFYKNQEVQITAKFVGIADDGRIQVKIPGIDNVTLNIDKKHVSAGVSEVKQASPMPSTTEPAKQEYSAPVKEEKKPKKKKKTAMDQAADDAWGASDGDDENNADDIKQETVGLLDASQVSIGDERFHHKHKHKTMSVESGGSVLKTTENKSVMCAFGTVECTEGIVYHWRVSIVEGKDVNLGVIFHEMCKKNKKQMWWLAPEGYSYWGDDGQIYHSDKYKKYGAKYGAGDVIDVWLNLKKWNISFAKNDEKYGKAFKVEKEKSYRFGVGLSGHPHVLQLTQFDIK